MRYGAISGLSFKVGFTIFSMAKVLLNKLKSEENPLLIPVTAVRFWLEKEPDNFSGFKGRLESLPEATNEDGAKLVAWEAWNCGF